MYPLLVSKLEIVRTVSTFRVQHTLDSDSGPMENTFKYTTISNILA